MSRALIVFLFLLFSPHSAHAIAIPPAALDEQAVSPECLTVLPSYLFGQGQVYGTDGKGPAIRIENGCASPVTIETFRTGSGPNELTQIAFIDAGFFADKSLQTKPEAFIFVPGAGDCAAVRAVQERANKDYAQKTAAHKAQLDRAASADEMLEQLSKSPTAISDTRPITCGGLAVPPGGLLALAMPWNTHYLITGSPGVKIAGHMINPLDVNSLETFQFAQNGDKTTRYLLALHNIETGQNLKIALRWLNEAAAEGYRPALYQLAQCYETGKCGVSKNAGEALFWRTLADPQVEPDGALYKRIEEWQKTHPEVTDY